MHICLTIPSLARAGGGTVAVVQSLSDHLAALADVVTVLTSEAGFGVAEALPRDSRVKVRRIPGNTSLGLKHEIRKLLGEPPRAEPVQVVHDFGLWQPFNHAVVSVCGELKLPRVASPSGMLAPWALRHKAWKKRLGWWLYQHRDLQRAAVLVAAAEPEARDIRKMVPGKSLALIPNGVELPGAGGQMGKQKIESRNEPSETQKEFLVSDFSNSGFKHVGSQGADRGLKTALFLGRIHPVKGLKHLVAAWNLVRPVGWQCIIAGPDEAGHQKELEALIRSHSLENVFHFPGLMEDGRKWELLNQADLFVLPSFTENFGMVVVEALAAGVPVVTTQGAPWAELLTHRCGWWVDIAVEPLAAALREAVSLSDSERLGMGRRGQDLVAEKYAWPRIAGEMIGVYRWVAGRGPMPACVA